MNEDWRTYKIGSLGKVITGKTPSTQEEGNFNGKYPFITIPDLDGRVLIENTERSLSDQGASRVKGSLLPKNAVMMSCIATIGRCGITTRPSFTNQQINSVICNEIADPRFLYYVFTQLGHELEAAGGGGSVYTNVSKSRFSDIEVKLPPLPEQRAIADVLSALDDKIELNRRINRTLEQLAQALFKHMFIDNPEREKWDEKPLDEIATFLNGLALQKFPPVDDNYLPVIKIAQLRTNNTENADKASAELDPAYVVNDGDVLFSWSGSLAVVLWGGGKGALNQHLFKVTSGSYPKWFYYYWIKYHLPDFQEIAAGKATTMGHIQRHHLSEAMVLVPPRPELESMTEVMAPLVEKIIANNIESRTLAELRDTLLPKLMSGQVRIN